MCRENKNSENTDNELVGMFLETNWGQSIAGEKKYDKDDGKRIGHFKTLDTTEYKHILDFDESQLLLRVFEKVSRGIARHQIATTTKNINLRRWFAPAIIGAKPKVVRGVKCDSVNDGYAIIGKHPDQLASQNGVHVFKSHVIPSMKVKLGNTAVMPTYTVEFKSGDKIC